MSLSRRELLLGGAIVVGGGLVLPFGSSASTAGVSLLTGTSFPTPFKVPFTPSPQLRGRVMEGTLEDGSKGRYRLFTIIEEQSSASIVPGRSTPVWGYSYIDDKGVKRPVKVPGPTIDVARVGAKDGQWLDGSQKYGLPAKVRVINRLPEYHPQFKHYFETSTHLHGSASKPQFDGYADDCTHPEEYKDYWYPNFQDARTLWYHDHGVHNTAHNAYGGLAAQYHLHDSYQERDLPKGAYDVGLTISDAMFAADGKLAYHDHEFSGLWGDVILVNGQPWPYMEVQRRVYRFRLLNASIARSLKLHLSDNSEFAVVGTDGGLMPPVHVREYRHAGAERYELLIDFARYSAGAVVNLMNRSNLNNKDYDHTNKIMQFRVVGTAPANLNGNTMSPRVDPHDIMTTPVNTATRTRRFELDHDDVTNVFKINHKTWDDVIKSKYTETLTGGIIPKNGETEIWEWANNSGGWFHPLHMHLVDFKILSRNGQAAFPWENGPKDVVYIGEDETVRLLVKFNLPPGVTGGKYMVHCHNLPHEDHDMMQQFAVGDVPADDWTDKDGVFCAKPAAVKGAALRNGTSSTAPGDDGYVPKRAGDADPFGDGVWLANEK
jgi:FtsP/CotA-like multicopper oxidase with cupredoxin domain